MCLENTKQCQVVRQHVPENTKRVTGDIPTCQTGGEHFSLLSCESLGETNIFWVSACLNSSLELRFALCDGEEWKRDGEIEMRNVDWFPSAVFVISLQQKRGKIEINCTR